MIKNIYIIIFIFLILVINGCTTPVEDAAGSSEIFLKMPGTINPGMRNIISDSGEIIDRDTLNQNYFRYDIIIESRGRRIGFKQLKRNTEESLKIPSGIPISIFIGVYYAKNSTGNEEKYNVYLASDSVEDVKIMPGETENVSIDLDLSKNSKVDTFFVSDFDGTQFVNVTGGYISDDLAPYFSIIPLVDSGSNDSKTIRYYYNAVTGASDLSEIYIGYPIPDNPVKIGKLFQVITGWDSVKYWYVHYNGIYKSESGNDSWEIDSYGPPDQSDDSNYFEDIKTVRSIWIDGNNDSLPGPDEDFYYYFLSHSTGFLAAGYTFDVWSNLENQEFSGFSFIYPYYDYLIDVETDNSPDNENIIFVTKTGTYYINHYTLLNVVNNNKDEALKELKKIIRITNPADNRKSLLITGVEVIDKYIYLGTRQGIYRIKRNSSKWNSFVDSSFNSVTILDETAIELYDDLNGEPVNYFEYITPYNGGDGILVAATNRRIWFKDFNSGKIKELTVWDGLPFVPIREFSNSPAINTADYIQHSISPVNIVTWDSDYSNKIWIGTDYGIASVNYNKLF